jgi:hypothetical protein
VSGEHIPKDKKLEHAEDLERMSRILKRHSEEAKASEKKPACKDDRSERDQAHTAHPKSAYLCCRTANRE